MECVDRDRGFAAFRAGRSVCVRLQGRLDDAMARGVARQIPAGARVVRLRLECSTLHAIDPAAARSLADELLQWTRRQGGRSVDIHNLQPALASSSALEPLHDLVVLTGGFHPSGQLAFHEEETETSRWCS